MRRPAHEAKHGASQCCGVSFDIDPTAVQEAAGQGAAGDVLPRLRRALEGDFFEILRHLFEKEIVPAPLKVQVDADRALLFQLPAFPRSVWFFPAVASGILKIVIPLALLAYFSSWLITRPLTRFAAAAERASTDDSLKEPFVVEGAEEVRSLAASNPPLVRDRIVRNTIEQDARFLSDFGHRMSIRPVYPVPGPKEIEMSDTELTISRVLRDPLIRQVLRADRTSLFDFALLLRENAVRIRSASTSSRLIMQPMPSDRRDPDRRSQQNATR